jgi:hypothetical protein
MSTAGKNGYFRSKGAEASNVNLFLSCPCEKSNIISEVSSIPDLNVRGRKLAWLFGIMSIPMGKSRDERSS